jgi:Flp pilus assembly pilin Flp
MLGRGRRRKEVGGAAMEYVLVSTFGLLVTIAALTLLTKVFQERFSAAAEKLGVTETSLGVDEIFGGGGE